MKKGLFTELTNLGTKATIETLDEINVPVPVTNGNVIAISKPAAPRPDAESLTLSVMWFGAASYHIRLGGVSVLTDPFVTYYEIQDLLGIKKTKSNPALVKSSYGSLPFPPKAIFIGHAHYDHMLDAVEALELGGGWNNVPLYGGKTVKHILAGYKKRKDPSQRWSQNWRAPDSASTKWNEIHVESGGSGGADATSTAYRLFYKSYRADHAPHGRIGQGCIGQINIKFFDGSLSKDLSAPPEFVSDFPTGETYVYLFQLTGGGGNKNASFTVALAGAATELPKNFHKEPVDVLILCVPGSQFVDEYPVNFIRALKPRVILLSHYDDFFKSRDKNFLKPNKDKLTTVQTSNLYSFLYKVQNEIGGNADEYARFEKILIPDVGATMYFKGE